MKNEGLLKAKKSGDIYVYHGEGKLTNISKGTRGQLDIEKMKPLFDIPITLNLFAERNPLMIDLIERLGLSVEPLSDDEKNNLINNWGESLQNQI